MEAGPDDARLLRAVLAALGVLGILGVWVLVALVALFFAVFDWPAPGPGPEQWGFFGLDHYLELSAAWAIGVGILGLARGYGRRPDGRRRSVRWLAWCDLGLLLAILWPVQAAVAGTVFAVRARSRAGWLRAGVALAGAGVLLAGTAWGVTGYQAAQQWTPARARSAALVGTWTSSDGGQLVLRANGEFTATNLPNRDPLPLANATGIWVLAQNGGPYPTLTLHPSGASGASSASGAPGGSSVDLDVFGGSSPSTLCASVDHRQPCGVTLHRG